MTEIFEATEDRAEHAAQILADSFQDDPVWSWAFPDRPGRQALLPRFLLVHVHKALTNGRLLIAGDGLGAATWHEVDDKDGHGDDSADAEMASVYDPYLERLNTLGELMRAAHPSHTPHLYLSLIGVRPEARGAGIGSALLRRGLTIPADTGGVPDQSREPERAAYPAYLEASSERNKPLYERHGFRSLGDPIRIQNGPTLYPMWREPEHPEAEQPRQTNHLEGAI